MFALVDCNSFFCSVEKVFHPGLNGKPVCVLSSNDGCIVALTPEAKALGLKRGDPLFKVKPVVEAHRVKLFSCNMPLYAAMSQRISNILRNSIHQVERYSIDECFCNLQGYEKYYNLTELMREVAEKVKLYTDVPVSVGIAPTKTLAKIGSKFAKKYAGYHGVCTIDTEEKRRKALSMISLDDVWGLGRNSCLQLKYWGIDTPLQLADQSEEWVRRHFHKPGICTWLELNGTACIDTAEVARNKSITSSRSFGQMVTDLDSLKSAVASFAASCANKLRGQMATTRTVTVFICSNTHREDLQQYAPHAAQTLLTPTADTLEITHTALDILSKIYKPGIFYKKAGVILSDIEACGPIQYDMFDTITNRRERSQLMKTLDRINLQYGAQTIQLAVENGKKQDWKSKSEHCSRNYLNNLEDILTIHI